MAGWTNLSSGSFEYSNWKSTSFNSAPSPFSPKLQFSGLSPQAEILFFLLELDADIAKFCRGREPGWQGSPCPLIRSSWAYTSWAASSQVRFDFYLQEPQFCTQRQSQPPCPSPTSSPRESQRIPDRELREAEPGRTGLFQKRSF